MTLCGVNIDDGRTHFVAELSCNHGGSLRRALTMLDAAKQAGASFAKIQAYTPDELVFLRGDGPAPAQWGEQGWTMRSLYEKAQTPTRWMSTLFAYAREIELPLFASVFGAESLQRMEECGCLAYKVASLDNAHKWLIDACKATGKPVIVSTDNAEGHYKHDDSSLTLFCPSGYPTERIALSYETFNDGGHHSSPVPHDGFSYHGTDIGPCLMAATLGAKLIEVHVQLDREPSELESNISLTFRQLTELVIKTRQMEAWRA